MFKSTVFRIILVLMVGAMLTPEGLCQDDLHLSLVADAAGMFNERGYLKSNSFSVDGNVVLNDFNGNLIYTQRLKYLPISPNGLSVDLKIAYNGSVGHTVNAGLDKLGNPDGCGPNNFNMPEWIISVNNIAIQALNFENEAVSFNTYEGITEDNEVAALINGYHSCYTHSAQPDGSYHGTISILMGDGSVRQFISLEAWAPGAGIITGEYCSFSKDDRAKGFVNDQKNFILFEDNGVKIHFEHYVPSWRREVVGDGGVHETYEKPQIYLPVRFEDVTGKSVHIGYWTDWSPVGCGYGRPMVQAVDGVWFEWVESTYGFSSLEISPFNTSIEFLPVNGSLPSNCDEVNRTYVMSITDAGGRKTDFSYENYARVGDEFANCNVVVAAEDDLYEYYDVSGSFQATPKRLTQITYPAGAESHFDYYDSDPDTVDYGTDCSDANLMYPCIKSDEFDNLGRDPFFINMVTSHKQFDEMGDTVSTESLSFSWQDGEDNPNYVSLDDRFFTERILCSPNCGSQKVYEFDYCYFTENAPFSLESRDRGWAVKLLTTRESEGGESRRIQTNQWNSITLQLSSATTTQDEVVSNVSYERVWDGSEAHDSVVNLVCLTVTDPNGIETQTNYSTTYFDIVDASSYYNNANVQTVRISDPSNSQLLSQTSSYYYDATADSGFAGQLQWSLRYFIDPLKGTPGSAVTEEYQYIKEPPLEECGSFEGALRKIISPNGDSTVYNYCERIDTTTDAFFAPTGEPNPNAGTVLNYTVYHELNRDGSIDTIHSSFFNADTRDWYRAVNYVGTDSLVYYKKVDDEGKPELIVEPNGYVSRVRYDELERVSRVVLPGDFAVTPISIEVTPTDNTVTPTCDAEQIDPANSPNVFNREDTLVRVGWDDPIVGDLRCGLFSFMNYDPYGSGMIVDSAFLNLHCEQLDVGPLDIGLYGANKYPDTAQLVWTRSWPAIEHTLEAPGSARFDVTPHIEAWVDNPWTVVRRVLAIEALSYPQAPVAPPEVTHNPLYAHFCSREHADPAKRPWLEVYGHYVDTIDNSYTIKYEYDDTRGDGDGISVTQLVRKDMDAFPQTTRTWLDGYARPIRTDFLDSTGTPGYDSVMMTYDFAGRVSRTTDQREYTTLQYYDYLNRSVLTVFPDAGASTNNVYYSAADVADTSSFDWPSGFNISGSQLYETIRTDENGNAFNEYSDLVGRLRLRRQYLDTSTADTYFDYDGLGNLTKIVRPEGDDVIYEYNSLGWLLNESAADYGSILYEYDKNGRLIRKRDANLAGQQDDAWLYTDLDELGRVTATGMGYKIGEYFEPYPHRRNYYDQGTSDNSKGRLSISTGTADGDDYGEQYDYDARGRTTGKRIVYHPGLVNTDDGWDIQPHPDVGLEHTIQYEYNHADQITSVTYPTGLVVTYEYDDRGRLKSVGDGNDPESYAAMTYTPRDKIETMTLGDGLQYVDYEYNERGWLTSINDGASVGSIAGDLFGQKLHYDDYPTHQQLEQLNGNIAGQSVSLAGEEDCAYAYAYDPMDRLTDVYANEYTGLNDLEHFAYDLNGNRTDYIQYGDNQVDYDYQYDALTNRIAGFTGSPGDMANVFDYDDNGNITFDSAKNAHFEYDIYNQLELVRLPGEWGEDWISFGYNNGDRISKTYLFHYRSSCESDPGPNPDIDGGLGSGAEGPFDPLFDADGASSETDGAEPSSGSPHEYCTYTMQTETHYVRGLGGEVLAEYILDNDGEYELKRQYIYAGGQRIAMIDDKGDLFYYLNDHLGSARVVFRESANPNQDQVADRYGQYWAFGADAGSAIQTNQPHRYTGKPFDSDGGLDLYYYGARYYDPVLGRFMAVDPLAGEYPGLSPYIYCANNPLKYVDPDGEAIETIVDCASIVLSAIDLIKEPSWGNAGWLAADVGCAAVPFLPAAGTVRHAGKLGKLFDKLTDAIGGANKVDSATDGATTLKKAPQANKGVAGKHGGSKHNDAIDGKIGELQKDKSVTEIRKNQAQADYQGNKAGTNRPDIQYNQDGTHHNIEFGYNAKRTQSQTDKILVNDPNATVDIVTLQK